MNGHGRSYGAVSVVNGIPCGVGAVMGTRLETVAEFGPSDSRTVIIVNDPAESTLMAETCVSEFYRRTGEEEPEGWMLRVDSQIPPSRGLKSSSSACNAIISALADFCGIRMEPSDIVLLGVRCARKSGVTVTGSFDDACGCAFGGICMTDNDRDSVIARRDSEDCDIIIRAPREKIGKRGVDADAYRALAPEFRRVLGIAMDRPFEAMTLNGELVSRATGIDNSLASRAMGMGALGAGISGTGPAVAIAVGQGDGRRFADDLGIPPDEVLLTRTRRRT